MAASKTPVKACRAICLTKEQWEAPPLPAGRPVSRVPGSNDGDRLPAAGDAGHGLARHPDLAAVKVRFKDGEIPGKRYGRNVELTDEAMAVLRWQALSEVNASRQTWPILP